MKLLALLFSSLLIVPAWSETPKITVVQATSVTCSFITAVAGYCRPGVVVSIAATKDPAEKFLVGVRYLAKDGTETIDSRYPVTAGSVWFWYGDDITLLSVTAGSLKTNEVTLWALPATN